MSTKITAADPTVPCPICTAAVGTRCYCAHNADAIIALARFTEVTPGSATLTGRGQSTGLPHVGSPNGPGRI